MKRLSFLTAEMEDKLKGFALGGDDYDTKPFNFDELRCGMGKRFLNTPNLLLRNKRNLKIGQYLLK